MSDPITLTIKGPDEIVATLPYQLGYHPRDSAVVVALEGRRLGPVARVDLPPGPVVPDGMVDAVLAPFRREGVERVVLVGYEDDEDASLPLLLALVEELERDRVEVVEVLVVRAGRVRSPVCSLSCCPPEGRPVPAAGDVAAVATYVALGSAPLAGRDEVDRRVAYDPLLPPPALRPRGVDGRDPRRVTVDAWAEVLGRRPRDHGVPSSRSWVTRVGLAAVGLVDIAMRDALCAWLSPGVLGRDAVDPVVLSLLERRMPRWGGMGDWSGREGDPGERRALLDVLTAACRAVPDTPAAAALCTVTAHVAWQGGDGALARAGVDRALRLAPEYRLALLLERLLENAVRPPGCPPSVTVQAS